MGIKKWVVKQGQKIANTTAKLSALSPAQIDNINKERDAYYSRLADLTESVTNTALSEALLAAGSVEVFNAYLPQIKEIYTPIVLDHMMVNKSPESSIRYFNITKWVNDKNENSLEKLINVYSVLSDENCNIGLIFRRYTDKTEVYIAVTDNSDNGGNNSTVKAYIERLHDAVNGNFPGAEIGQPQSGSPFSVPEKSSVATVTNIPTESSEKFISQTIEKLLDGIVPENKSKEYTIILLATPIRDVEERKLRLSEIYSGFASYASWQTSFTYTETNAQGSSANFGVNAGVSAGVQNGQNSSVGQSTGNGTQNSTANGTAEASGEGENKQITNGEGVQKGEAQNKVITNGTQENQTAQHSEQHGTNENVNSGSQQGSADNAGLSLSIFGCGPNVGTSVSSGTYSGTSTGTSSSFSDGTSVSFGSSQSLSEGTTVSSSQSQNHSESIGSSISHQVTKSIVNTLGRTVTKTVSNTVGLFSSVNFGGNFGANFARASSVTATIGNNETITQYFTNYNVKHALELIEEQMKRFEQSSALGMWDFAAYIVSDDPNVANNVSHTYLSLTEGEKSYMSRPAVNLWRGDLGKNCVESEKASEICQYLNLLQHPVFGINPEILEKCPDYSVYPPVITATTPLSGKELALSLNFPRKSVAGLPVIECAEFGRNVASYDGSSEETETLELGNIYHMHHEEKLKVNLSARSLASHTFITGSTGSGKSNTIYNLLSEALRNGKKFMVIEPAKGEYKHIFGMDPNVSVYGTNPEQTPLFRLDPFSFPKEIHVLEHMDRLVEIFNVCWPMYAAMPAVLKSAIERSYEDCGWELTTSKNAYGDGLYPSFADVARNIKTIINSSEYDNENKGAYKGSLLTRLSSLTNGINGMIFNRNELSSDALFDNNVIIDLSRVGSTETKSLLMGILILKLQEYRMTSGEINSALKHITVLEEAHNILKRTSTEQNMEIGNLAGKSVEMISNAIAEMRTYGEGFIIADQAPGLLDMSVIRNTNTKIIMRLPDKEDRELVGKAAGMNDDQIEELAKLPCGVAAVYQNEWVQPVLCKVKKYNNSDQRYSMTVSKSEAYEGDIMTIRLKLASCLLSDWPPEFPLQELDMADLPSSSKVDILQYQQRGGKISEATRSSFVCSLFPDLCRRLSRFGSNHNVNEIKQTVQQNLDTDWAKYINDLNEKTSDVISKNVADTMFSNLIDMIIKCWSYENSIRLSDESEVM